MKSFKILSVFAFIIFVFGICNSPAGAQTPTSRQRQNNNLRTNPLEFRRNMMMRVSQNFRNKASKLLDAVLEEINGNNLIVSKDGKKYTVNTNQFTGFRRHYWDKSLISVMSVGDKINIWGMWADNNKTEINATLIRDLSIMKRDGVFFGIIKSRNDNSFIIDSKSRGEQAVFFTSSTKFINRREDKILISNLKTGDKIRVKGVWDKATNKITEVLEVKDFSK